VGFEPTVSAFAQAKSVHALDRSAIVTGINLQTIPGTLVEIYSDRCLCVLTPLHVQAITRYIDMPLLLTVYRLETIYSIWRIKAFYCDELGLTYVHRNSPSKIEEAEAAGHNVPSIRMHVYDPNQIRFLFFCENC
jgi:hypothetical protein